MASLALGVKFNPVAGGLTDFAYSSAVLGYVGPAASNPAMVDGKTYRYRAESADLSQWEFGSGVYTASTQTIARTTITLSSTGAKVSFTAPPQVGIVIFPADVLLFDDAMSLTAAQQAQALANLGLGTPLAGWTTYTPTVSSAIGTITTASATGRYKQIGKTVICQMEVTITTAGTGAGGINVGLPFTAAAFNYAGSCREHNITGKAGGAWIAPSGTTADIRDAAGATYIANGNGVTVGITYEVP